MRLRDIRRIKYRKSVICQYDELQRIKRKASEDAKLWKNRISATRDDKLIRDLYQLMIYRFLQRKSHDRPTFATRNLRAVDTHNSQMPKEVFVVDCDITSEYPRMDHSWIAKLLQESIDADEKGEDNYE